MVILRTQPYNMSKNLLIITSVFIGLTSCNSGNNSASGKTDSTTKESKTVEKVKDAATGMDDIKETLTSLTPISAEDLKKLLPEQLGGASPSNAEVENSSGVNIASADYKLNDSTAITLSIIDCAGPAGVGIYTTQHLGMAAAEGETEEEYTKAVTINGNKGYEHCYKDDSNDCSIVWFTGNRYLVSIEGLAAAPLKQLAGQIKIK